MNIAELAGFAYPRIGLQKAAENAELGEQVGLPLRPGPWYNASIGLTHGNHMANCQFTVIGSKHSSDIYMRVNSSCLCTLLYKLGFYTLPGTGGAACFSTLLYKLGFYTLPGTRGAACVFGSANRQWCPCSGCEDQGSSKHSAVQYRRTSKVGCSHDGGISVSRRGNVSQHQPHGDTKSR